jgi:hypothetical protein
VPNMDCWFDTGFFDFASRNIPSQSALPIALTSLRRETGLFSTLRAK